VDGPRALVQAMLGYLAPGGVLVVDGARRPMSAFDRHIGASQHFTRASIAALLAAAGCAVDRIYSGRFPFFNLYRLTVIARGRKLVTDGQARAGRWAARWRDSRRRFYRGLFRFNLLDSPLGWQVVAVARKRA